MFRFFLFFLCFSVALAQEKSLDTALVSSINKETLALRLKGNYKQALAKNDSLLEHLTSFRNTLSYAKTLHTRSRVQIDLGLYDNAIQNAKDAKKIYEHFSAYTAIAAVDNIVGVGFYFKSEMDSTLHYYNKSYLLKKKHEKDTIQLAISIFNIGIVYEDQGKLKDAIAAYSEAEDLLMASSEKAIFMSDLYVALSNVYRSRNDLVKSKSYAQLALKETIAQHGEDNPSTSFVYVSNAGLYKVMGDYETAKPFLKKALELRKKYYGATHRWTVESYRSLAETYLNLKQTDSALVAINTAITISEEQQYPLDIANNYIEKARILIETNNRKEEAMELIQKSRKLYIDIFGNFHQYIAESHYLEAKVRLSMGDTIYALQQIDKVYEASRYNPQDLSVLNAPFIVAKTLHLQFELSTTALDKMQFIDKQIALNSHIKNYYQTPEAKLFYNATTTSNISDYVAFCEIKFIETQSEVYFNKALELVQLATNSILAQERQNISLAKDNPWVTEPLKQLNLIREQWAKINQDIYYAETDTTPDKNVLDRLLEQKSEISRRLDRALVSYESSSLETLNELTVYNLSEVKTLLQDNQLVVQYYVGKQNVYLFYITKDKFKLKKLGGAATMTSLVNNFRKQLLDRAPTEVYQKQLTSFLLPKEIFIEDSDIIFIPDGILAYVPFELLMSTAQEMLLEKHNISYQPALSFLNESITNTKYNEYWSGFGVGYQGVQSLPKGIDEVKTIAKLTQGQVYLNQHASKHQLFEKGKDSKILHLALHGIIDVDNPLYSKFLLENETVTASEIYNKEVRSRLVVLSACETGYGSLQKGEGVMSLSRAFTFAGASSTIMSLWEVPDEQTALLMTNFYTYLKDGMPIDEALRLAKLAFIEEAPTTFLKHPYYWAGFVVSGAVSPVEDGDSNVHFLRWLAIAVILLMFIGLYIRNIKSYL